MFEFLFKYPRVAFEQGRVALATPVPWLALVVAALVLAAVAAWTYRTARGRVRPRDRAVLAALRTGLFAVLLLALLRPALRVAVAVEQENYVGVLIDDSRSMRVADLPEGTRGEEVLRALGADDGALIRGLSERFRVRLFRFSDGAERVEEVGALGFAGGQTRLGPALDHARAELAGLPVAGMVVVTDGADRGEVELNRSLLALRAASIPVYTVGVGRESFARDVEVRRVSTPRAVLRGASLVVDVLVAQTGYAGRTVDLLVEDEGEVVQTEPVELPLDGTPAAVRVTFTAAEAGERRIRFRVPLQDGELVRENNEREAVLTVREGPQKILYVEGEPRFEVKFMRRAVEDDEQIQLVVLQRTAQDKFLRLAVDSASELAGGFPRTREELFAYRGLVLGSIEAGYFTAEQLRLIADFVAERGGGLLALGGRRALAEGGYAGTALADVLPVVLEDRPDTAFFAEVKVAPTRAGVAHAALRMEAAAGGEGWATLPALTAFNRVTRLKPGATALLTGAGPGGRDQVVLAAQRYGRGLSIALPVQDTWTWQMHAEVPLEDQRHEIFWRQMLRWLVSDVPDPVTVTASSDRPAAGQPVRLVADLRDRAYLPLNDAGVVAHLSAPDGSTRELPMRWTARRDGEYEASFTPGAVGFHRVRVEATRAGENVGSGSLALSAADDDGEYYGAQMRAPLLRRVAEETGGRFYTLDQLDRVPEEVRYSGQGVTMVEQRDLWDMPVLFLLIVGLAAGEWGYRRARGMQ